MNASLSSCCVYLVCVCIIRISLARIARMGSLCELAPLFACLHFSCVESRETEKTECSVWGALCWMPLVEVKRKKFSCIRRHTRTEGFDKAPIARYVQRKTTFSLSHTHMLFSLNIYARDVMPSACAYASFFLLRLVHIHFFLSCIKKRTNERIKNK